jgi:streptomycin 6-kinase
VRLSRPCPEATIRYALGCARRRSAALEPHRCVVVHGDAAAANALQVLQPRPGAETGFVFVDPDSFLGDPTYDLGVALRDWTLQLLGAGDPARLLRRYCQVLAATSGMDPAAIWDWGFLERVSTGLYVLSLGADQLARPSSPPPKRSPRPPTTDGTNRSHTAHGPGLLAAVRGTRESAARRSPGLRPFAA